MFLLTSNAFAQSADEVDFITSFFNELQTISIAENREYCGYFGIDASGNFIATPPTAGDTESCFADEPPLDMDIIASYHTHGAYAFGFDSEVPSPDDLAADIAEENDGYISTPGGRIWFNDSIEEISTLLCGRNCTVSDSQYVADTENPVNNSYTLEQLSRR